MRGCDTWQIFLPLSTHATEHNRNILKSSKITIRRLTFYYVKSNEKFDGLWKPIIVVQAIGHVSSASGFAGKIVRMRPSVYRNMSLRGKTNRARNDKKCEMCARTSNVWTRVREYSLLYRHGSMKREEKTKTESNER